jgi:hypothetical protein
MWYLQIPAGKKGTNVPSYEKNISFQTEDIISAKILRQK